MFNKDGKQVGPGYCGFYPNGFGVKIAGNSALVSFMSDNYIKNKGFNASYETISTETRGIVWYSLY